MSTHLAAMLPSKGQPLEVQPRPTPKPGPGELLIAVKSIALNPGENLIRSTGLFIPSYPTTFGFDIAGVVLEVGSDVPTDNDQDIFFQPGVTRVAAFAAFFWKAFNPDYGSFQERCLVPWQHAVPVPESLSWNQAATLPASVVTPLSAWDILGIPRLGQFKSGKTAKKDEALLIWGASSSIGTMGVQSARLLKGDQESSFAAVYAVAGSSNHEYVKSLGADRVFDYKDAGVVDTIIAAAREEGLAIRHCFLATGQLVLCQAVLKAFVGEEDHGEKGQAKIASAPRVPEYAKVVSGVETIFVIPPGNEEKRLEHFQYWMGTWLRENLAKGAIKPSPEPKAVGKGVEAINAGLDTLAQGVSCTKLVVEMSE